MVLPVSCMSAPVRHSEWARHRQVQHDDLYLIVAPTPFALPLAANPNAMVSQAKVAAKRDIAWAYRD
jgi:hypothetical protein